MNFCCRTEVLGAVHEGVGATIVKVPSWVTMGRHKGFCGFPGGLADLANEYREPKFPRIQPGLEVEVMGELLGVPGQGMIIQHGNSSKERVIPRGETAIDGDCCPRVVIICAIQQWIFLSWLSRDAWSVVLVGRLIDWLFNSHSRTTLQTIDEQQSKPLHTYFTIDLIVILKNIQ